MEDMQLSILTEMADLGQTWWFSATDEVLVAGHEACINAMKGMNTLLLLHAVSPAGVAA